MPATQIQSAALRKHRTAADDIHRAQAKYDLRIFALRQPVHRFAGDAIRLRRRLLLVQRIQTIQDRIMSLH